MNGKLTKTAVYEAVSKGYKIDIDDCDITIDDHKKVILVRSKAVSSEVDNG